MSADGALRERIAKAMFEAGRVDRGPEYGAVDWQYIRGRHRESWLRLADAAISALTAAGSPVGDAGLTREQVEAVRAVRRFLLNDSRNQSWRVSDEWSAIVPSTREERAEIYRQREQLKVVAAILDRALAAQGTGGG